MLEIRLLGAFEIRYGGKSIDLPSRPAQSLFAYLAINRRPHRRERLAGIFWPESSEERARASLRHELWRIRKAMAAIGVPDALLSDDITVAFAPTSGYELDVARLEQAADDASADQLRQALAAYTGELLPGFYDEWVVTEREHLQRIFEQRVERLLRLLEEENSWPEMIEWAERWISAGAGTEQPYRSLMVAYAGLGERVKVRVSYERCVQALHALGLEPSEEIRALREAREAPSNLPAPLGSLIGREKEIAEISGILLTDRLVTLTGAGGVGKTRLAIEVARGLVDEFPDGICYLELASISEPEAVPERLRSLLRVHGAISKSQTAMELLCAHFQPRHALLVLDNCEHLIEACAQLANALLTAAAGLHILVTSRESLRVVGETAYRVPSLELPSPEDMSDAEALARVDSVRLFVERARARSRSFAWNAATAGLVAQICVRLDGIPLALELAAARVDTLPLESMVEHLNDRFALLSGGLRTDLPRHKTLRAMIDWSYDLLSEPERVLLRHLSVFSGGWTLEAAQRVAGDGILRQNDVLGLLPELVEKSLVVLEPESNRYHMLETMREYALEHLQEAGMEERIRNRHLDYFLELAEAADLAAMKGEGGNAQLAGERDNLIAAIAWAAGGDEDQVQKGLLLVGAARLSWLLIPELEMPYRLGRRLLSLPAGQPRNFARCRALLAVVQGAYYLGRWGDAEVIAAAAESVAIAREIGDRRREAQTLNLYGNLLAAAGEPQRGLQCLKEALVIAQELGLLRLSGKILSETADILRLMGDLAAAEPVYEQAIAVQEQTQAPHDLIFTLLNSSSVAIVRGNLSTARRRLLGILKILGEIPRGMSDLGPPLQTSAALMATTADWRRAAVLFGAAERQRETANRTIEPGDVPFILPLIDRACEALGEAEFRAAWAEGRRLPAQAAMDYARECLSASQ